jgi:hypothetical protein
VSAESIDLTRESRSSIELSRTSKGERKPERNRAMVEMAMQEGGATLAEIGARFGITKQAVNLVLKAAGVQSSRPRKPRAKDTYLTGPNHQGWKGDLASARAARYRSHRVIRELGVCEECGERPAVDRHHVDENTKNNDPSNLRALCRGCHSRIHGRVPPWERARRVAQGVEGGA